MTVVFIIAISILSSLLCFTIYRLIKLNKQFKIEKTRGDTGWEQCHKIEAERDFLNNVLDKRDLKISSLKNELSSLKNREVIPVTRIETYTPQMRVLKHSVELCTSDFGEMPKEQIIELAKDELYKNMFELIKPHILVIETNDIYHMRTTVYGKIIVEDRGGKE